MSSVMTKGKARPRSYANGEAWAPKKKKAATRVCGLLPTTQQLTTVEEPAW